MGLSRVLGAAGGGGNRQGNGGCHGSVVALFGARGHANLLDPPSTTVLQVLQVKMEGRP